MSKARIGLLPFYLELYDGALPEKRVRLEKFYDTISAALRGQQLEVITSSVCRVKREFERGITSFEEEGVDAIVTLHLAYSPSLESADILARTPLPVIILDTTPTYEFGPGQSPDEIIYNHGIHGVQDLCNLLLRRGKVFRVEAGHWQKSDVLKRVARWARSARLTSQMRRSRVGLLGEPFKGMGDFSIPHDILKERIGIDVIHSTPQILKGLLPDENDPEVESDVSADMRLFVTRGLDAEAHVRSIRAGIVVRRWIEKEKLSAFTVNFMSIDRNSVLPTVPFLEASKAMSRGLGYAGEGDVLSAALVGALGAVFGDTTFTEMFCPDWKNNSIFLSHMGEVNVGLVSGKPRLVARPFPWTDTERPVSVAGRLKGGKAVLVDLAPAHDGFALVIAPVRMLNVKGKDRMADFVHGWFRPQMSISNFLEEYSRAGGTHHLALVYGDVAKEIEGFGQLMGWRTVVLGKAR